MNFDDPSAGREDTAVDSEISSPRPEGEGSGVRVPARETKEAAFREAVSKVMVQVSRALRQRSTDAEAYLWEYLRDRRLDGIKFRRQQAVANTTFVADFYCYESRLAIELDGEIHEHQQEADLIRQQEIEGLGHCVLRFRNKQIFNNIEDVLNTILAAHYNVLSGASPLPHGEGKKASA